MQWNKRDTITALLGIGLLLAASKIVYLFFNFLNIVDVLVFVGAGYFVGLKVFQRRWQWGFVLAIPCMVFDAIIVYNQGYTNIMAGIGTSFLIALVVVPLSACFGIWLKCKKIVSPENPV